MRCLQSCFRVLPLLAALSFAQEPATLTIDNGDIKRVWAAPELKSKALDFETSESPIFKGKRIRFKAVALPSLFKSSHLPAGAMVQIGCADGFSSELSAALLLNEDAAKAEALIAIEEPEHPWPTIQRGGEPSSAGPFYLIWKHPDRSQIKPEQWPYQVVSLVVKQPLSERYPDILPSATVSPGHSIRRGFEIFVTHCFPCHRLNDAGNSDVGPDLNLPFNPTEYWPLKRLRAFIRDPQSLHHWPQERMPAFASEALSDAALDDLLEYLKHMAPRKAHPSQP